MSDFSGLLFVSRLVSLLHKIYSEEELAKALQALMGELGDQEFLNAISALENASQSEKYRLNWLFDAIHSWGSAAPKFEASWKQIQEGYNRANKMRSILSVASFGWVDLRPDEDEYFKKRVELEEKHALCYALIAITLNTLEGERKNVVKHCGLFHTNVVKYLKFEVEEIRKLVKRWDNLERKVEDPEKERWDYLYHVSARVPSEFVSYREQTEACREYVTKRLELLTRRKKDAIAILRECAMPTPGLDPIPERLEQFRLKIRR